MTELELHLRSSEGATAPDTVHVVVLVDLSDRTAKICLHLCI